MIKAYIVFCYAFRSGVGLDVRLHLGKLFLFNLARFLIFEKEEKGPYLRRYGGARKKKGLAESGPYPAQALVAAFSRASTSALMPHWRLIPKQKDKACDGLSLLAGPYGGVKRRKVRWVDFLNRPCRARAPWLCLARFLEVPLRVKLPLKRARQ